MKRWGVLVIFLVCSVSKAAAVKTRHEVWPRVEVYIPLKTRSVQALGLTFKVYF